MSRPTISDLELLLKQQGIDKFEMVITFDYTEEGELPDNLSFMFEIKLRQQAGSLRKTIRV